MSERSALGTAVADPVPDEWAVTVRGDDLVELHGRSTITAFDHCQITVYGECTVTAYDDCQITVVTNSVDASAAPTFSTVRRP